MDDKVKTAVDHVKTHVTYPVTTEQLVVACENWSDVDPTLKEQAEMKLKAMPGKMWNSADEVLGVLGWPAM